MSIGAPAPTTFIELLVGAVDTSGCGCLVNDDAFQRNSLRFNKLSSISFSTASIFSSSLIWPNLFSNLFVVDLRHVFGSISFTDNAD